MLQACKRSSTTAGVIFLAALFISLAWVLSQVYVCVCVVVGRRGEGCYGARRSCTERCVFVSCDSQAIAVLVFQE